MKDKAILTISLLVGWGLISLSLETYANGNYGQRYANDNRTRGARNAGGKDAKNVNKHLKKESKTDLNNDANRAADSSGSASGMNKAIGAALIAAGMAPKPPIMPLVMMGIMAMMQGGEDSKTQNYATGTGFDTYNGADGKKAGVNGSGLTSGEQRQFDEAKQALEDSGGKLNSDGSITTAAGTTLTGNDFANPEGLSAKGFDGKEIAAVKDGLGIAEKAGKNLKLAYGSGGGGGSGGSAGADGGSSEADIYGDDSLSDGDSLLSELNRKSSVAGMTRSLASDRIGVAGDNIFDMLSRRYQAKQRAADFLP